MTASGVRSEAADAAGEIRLLATILTIFAAVKVLGCSLAYASAIVSMGGVDNGGGQTMYWLPQILFYTIFLASVRRLRRLEPRGRTAVVSLSILSLVAIVLYAVLDFTVGRAAHDPAMGIAIKLRLLLSGGDVWDLVFPSIALLRLRAGEVRALFDTP